MSAALLMIRICVVRVCTTVKGTGFAEHSQFARYTAGANVAPRAICQRLRCALVLFKKSCRYLPRSAFGQPSICRSPPGPCPDVYLEDGRIQIDNNLVENFILPTALGKRTGCSQAMPMPANAAPSLNCYSRPRHLRSKYQNYGGWRDAYPVSARSTFEAADDVVLLELGEEVQAQMHQAHDRSGSQGRAQALDTSQELPIDLLRLRWSALIAIRSFRSSIRSGSPPATSDSCLSKASPTPSEYRFRRSGTGSSRARESEGLLAALRGSLRSPRGPRSMCD
jgi:hypothetical protein